MTLSKQLYIIISFIFFMIFAGNFVISVHNFKEYLEIESKTKAQDTATSLGMSLKSLIHNKNDKEIETIIKAISNRGFYKEIRLEDVQFNFTKNDLLKKASLDDSYEISDIKVDKKIGTIVSSKDDISLENELALLEGYESSSLEQKSFIYSFVPNKDFISKNIDISFIAKKENIKKNISLSLGIDRVLVKVNRAEKFEKVPKWFMEFISLKMEETKSEISDGWKTAAIIYVSANAGEAYAKLYEQAKGAIYYAIVAFSISILLMIVFLRFILQPLREIDQLAQNISHGKFETITTMPWTTELKNVSLSMNDMSDKIKNMINKLNSNLEKMTEQLSKDDLTSLQLEQTFQTDMKQMFIKKQTGYVFSIKISDLAGFAKNNDNKTVNSFLKEFATILEKCDDNLKAYRFFGSTFALISYKDDYKDIKNITNSLKSKFDALGDKYNINSVAHIGVTPFNPISTTQDILDLANEALEMAKQIGHNEAYIRDKNDLARDMLEWKELIFDIIDNQKFNVGYINDAITLDDKNQLVMEEAFTSAKDKNNRDIPIGTFISIAEEYNKVIDFDKAVILKVIGHIEKQNLKHDILINLAFDSLMDHEFKLWLANTLKSKTSIANQMVFSSTAYGCTRDIDAFKSFIDLVHENNGKVVIKRFESKFIPLNNLKEFNLDYIRLARDYTNNIANDPSKQNFVESICELSKLLNIKVFAESVKDEESFSKLKELGMFAASK